MRKPPAATPHRPWGLAALVLAVLSLHALLLQGGLRGPAPNAGHEAPAALQVRQLVQAVAPPEPAPATPPSPPAPAPVLAAARSVPAAPPTPTAPPTPLATTAEPDPSATAAADTTSTGEAVPVYATRLPPPATLQYTVQRDTAARSGAFQAELRWRPAAESYALTLGIAATGWASVGQLDAHGVAPERQVETRRGREVRAVNFQRDSARITFSGPQLQFPLLPGSQDRISWLVQLPAVLAANPALAEAGRELRLFVAGARGDAGLWVFTVAGIETTELPGGPVAGTVHLQRVPRVPYDTRVDVWLDPARHHLPVRVRLQTRADSESTELLLSNLSMN